VIRKRTNADKSKVTTKRKGSAPPVTNTTLRGKFRALKLQNSRFQLSTAFVDSPCYALYVPNKANSTPWP